MATANSIQPTLENIRTMQSSINEMDGMVQRSQEKIEAATGCIKLLLKKPDSRFLRGRLKALCDLINDQAFDAKNCVNSESEKWSANYIDEFEREEISQIFKAVKEDANV